MKKVFVVCEEYDEEYDDWDFKVKEGTLLVEECQFIFGKSYPRRFADGSEEMVDYGWIYTDWEQAEHAAVLAGVNYDARCVACRGLDDLVIIE